MSVRWHCYLACTQCNDQFIDRDGEFTAETARAVRSLARAKGWIYCKVPNGSYWDICRRCQEREKSE